jgi:hypothetical protein
MPSIAGVAIVGWLCAQGGDGLCSLLYLPSRSRPLDTPSLTLLFLYGNLFCYIASYPVLVFHATRVIDFPDGKWTPKFWSDGYITAFIFTLASFAVFHFRSANVRFYGAFAVAVIIVGVQLARLYRAILTTIEVKGLNGKVSYSFGYAYALAVRRGIPEETQTISPTQSTKDESNSDAEFGGDVTTSRTIAWRREFIETYRHLREHGNSAFIFLFEIALAALVYSAITKPGQTPAQQIGAVGTLFALWAVPAVFVHLLGQHFERRFSWFDRRLNPE